MTSNHEKMRHDDASLLLPWFVNKTLDGLQNAAVLHHVKNCGECAENVDALTRMQSAIRQDELSPLVPTPNVERVFDTVGRLEKAPVSRRFIVFASAAALATLAVVAYLPESTVIKNAGQFETATSTTSAITVDYVLTIEFEATAAEASRKKVITDLKALDVQLAADGRQADVTVRLAAFSLQEIETYSRLIESNPAVKKAQVIAVQLPVRTD